VLFVGLGLVCAWQFFVAFAASDKEGERK
jgi:hypothetical protein